MANDGFDGTTITFNGNTINTKLLSVSHTQSGNPIDVTGSTKTRHEFINGITSHELTFEAIGVGSTGITLGATGTMAIAWFDGTNTSITNCIVTAVDTTGSVDDRMTTSFTVQPWTG